MINLFVNEIYKTIQIWKTSIIWKVAYRGLFDSWMQIIYVDKKRGFSMEP